MCDVSALRNLSTVRRCASPSNAEIWISTLLMESSTETSHTYRRHSAACSAPRLRSYICDDLSQPSVGQGPKEAMEFGKTAQRFVVLQECIELSHDVAHWLCLNAGERRHRTHCPEFCRQLCIGVLSAAKILWQSRRLAVN